MSWTIGILLGVGFFACLLIDALRYAARTYRTEDTEDDYMRRRHVLGLRDDDPRSAREVEYARGYIRDVA